MGSGMVLESGTHDELLQTEMEPMHVLCKPETKDNHVRDSDGTFMDLVAAVTYQETTTRRRGVKCRWQKETGSRSLASEILEQRQKQEGGEVKMNTAFLLV